MPALSRITVGFLFNPACNHDPPASPLAAAVGRVFLGKSAWVQAMRERLAGEPADGNVQLRRRLAWRPSAAEIVQVIQRHFQVPSSAF